MIRVARLATGIATFGLLGVAAPSGAQDDGGSFMRVPYGVGERLEYDVKFGKIKVGSGTMEVAGVQDVRFQELMPDIFHWLGIARIDRFASMSNMKSDALRQQGIEIVEQVPIPDELIPADAQVEMDAKKAAGYFSTSKPGSNELARAKGRALNE